MEVAFNVKNDTPENQQGISDIVERAYNKVSKMKWSVIASNFKVIIDKCCK
jgi:hypothetical protein